LVADHFEKMETTDELSEERRTASKPRYRTLIAAPLKEGGWQVRDSAGMVGGFFRDRSTALKAVVRERWAKNVVLEVASEALE
jgi:hypothetical protein